MKRALALLISAALCPVLSLVAQDRQPAPPAVLSVTSNPVGAIVIIDGSYAGLTPLREQKLTVGLHALVLKLRGFLTLSDSVEVRHAGALTREYEMHPACALSVTSDPAGGSVYVNNAFFGISPLVLDELKPGPTIVAVSRPFYFTRIDTVNLSPGVLTRVTMMLSPRPATLSIEVPAPDVEVFINNRLVSRGSLRDTLIVPGEFEIAARQPSPEKSVSTSGFVLPNATARYRVSYDLLSRDPFYSSLLLPGSGQRKAGSPALGWGIEIAFGGALALALGAEIKGVVSYADYSTTHGSYDQALTKAEAFSFHNTAQQQYNSAISAFRVRDIGLWSALAVYVLSAADAFFFHNREDVIIEVTQESSPGLSGQYRIDGPAPRIRVGVKL